MASASCCKVIPRGLNIDAAREDFNVSLECMNKRNSYGSKYILDLLALAISWTEDSFFSGCG